MSKSAVWVGVLCIVFGIWLAFQVGDEPAWLYLYPLILIVLGVFLMVKWRAEDTIEQRKDS